MRSMDRPIADDFAPDLNYLLHSEQVPPEVVLEALVQEFYPQIFYLALTLLHENRAARRAVEEIFIRAVAERSSYQPEQAAGQWLQRLALRVLQQVAEPQPRLHKIEMALGTSLRLRRANGDRQQHDTPLWAALDNLQTLERWCAVLYFVHNWPVSYLAEVLGAPPHKIEHILAKVRHTLLNTGRLGGEAVPLNPLEADVLLQARLKERWQFPLFTEGQLQEVATQLANRALRRSQKRQRFTFTIEIALVILLVALGGGGIWGVTRLSAKGGGPSDGTPPTEDQEAAQTPTSIFWRVATEYAPHQGDALGPPSTSQAVLFNQAVKESDFVIVQEGDTLETLAKRIGVTEQALRELNRLPEGMPLLAGMRLLNPARLPMDTPVPFPALPPLPNDLSLTLEEIITQPPPYTTVWFEALIWERRNPSESGAPPPLRLQMWHSPSVALVLAGRDAVLPEEVYLRHRTVTWLARPLIQGTWLAPWQLAGEYSSPIRNQIQALEESLLAPQTLASSSMLQARGHEEQSGVLALVVDQFDAGGRWISRIWVDERSGFFLRRAFYGPEGGEPLLLVDYVVLRVAYQVPFPPLLFDPRLPWRGGFAAEASGAPQALPSSAHGEKPPSTP